MFPLSLEPPSSGVTAVVSIIGGWTTDEGVVPGNPINSDGRLLCSSESSAPESLYIVDVPSGSFDLIVNVLDGRLRPPSPVFHVDYPIPVSVRSKCESAHAQLDCAVTNTDNSLEVLNVASGRYTILIKKPREVLRWEQRVRENGSQVKIPNPRPFNLQVALRPVLDSTAPCDPNGLDNRCGKGACPAEGKSNCP